MKSKVFPKGFQPSLTIWKQNDCRSPHLDNLTSFSLLMHSYCLARASLVSGVLQSYHACFQQRLLFLAASQSPRFIRASVALTQHKRARGPSSAARLLVQGWQGELLMRYRQCRGTDVRDYLKYEFTG